MAKFLWRRPRDFAVWLLIAPARLARAEPDRVPTSRNSPQRANVTAVANRGGRRPPHAYAVLTGIGYPWPGEAHDPTRRLGRNADLPRMARPDLVGGTREVTGVTQALAPAPTRVAAQRGGTAAGPGGCAAATAWKRCRRER